MAHHRIFHVRECGADPQFVPAVITSGQSGAVINITVLAARAQTGGAIGTGRLGWAGLGWAGMWKSSNSSSSAIPVRAARGDEFIILC